MDEKGPHNNIIRITKEKWDEKRRSLGFSVPETIPENLQAEIRKFLRDLMAAQVLLGVFEDSQTDSSALEKQHHGLVKSQHSYIRRQLALKAEDIKEEKLALISVIIETFSDCLVKIKKVLGLLEEEEYQATDIYKGLKNISIILKIFVIDLRQSTPQNAERIISEFRNNLLEQITMEAE